MSKLRNLINITLAGRDGMIWMLGGRSGSTILHHNEVLMYPGTYSGTQHKMWAWMNKVSKIFEQALEKYLKNKVTRF